LIVPYYSWEFVASSFGWRLVQFAQQHDVFICNLVAIVKIYQGQLYTLYNDGNSSFFGDEFFVFKSLLDFSHDHIHMK
jgi:hypothetical protein